MISRAGRGALGVSLLRGGRGGGGGRPAPHVVAEQPPGFLSSRLTLGGGGAPVVTPRSRWPGVEADRPLVTVVTRGPGGLGRGGRALAVRGVEGAPRPRPVTDGDADPGAGVAHEAGEGDAAGGPGGHERPRGLGRVVDHRVPGVPAWH